MSRWRPIATTVISVVGLAIATYLTYVHYSSAPGKFNAVCPLGGTHGVINCDKVTTSAQSIIFGIPVALYGAVFFLFMIAVNLPVSWRSPSMWLARARLAAVICGMGMVLYLISMEAFVIHAICIWCSAVHLLQFALFILVTTGWQDTGWVVASSGEPGEEDEELEDDLEEEPEPAVLYTRGNRPPRGKARRQAATARG